MLSKIQQYVYLEPFPRVFFKISKIANKHDDKKIQQKLDIRKLNQLNTLKNIRNAPQKVIIQNLLHTGR